MPAPLVTILLVIGTALAFSSGVLPIVGYAIFIAAFILQYLFQAWDVKEASLPPAGDAIDLPDEY